jgi:hypothetical protein
MVCFYICESFFFYNLEYVIEIVRIDMQKH